MGGRWRGPSCSPMPLPSMQELYWLAGLLEGEGCFTWNKCYSKGKYVYYRPKIQIGMTDKDVLERAASLIGVNVCAYIRKKLKPHHKDLFRFECQGKRAIGWMQTLYPLLGLRRQAKIREILVKYKSEGTNNS